jgi:AraC-like DNA-binding protein
MICFGDFMMISGGLFSLVLMAGTLAERNKGNIKWVMALIYLCHSSIVINKGLACSGLVFRFPWLMHVDLFTFYLIGPAIYFYLKIFSDSCFQFKWKHLLHLLPAVAVVLLYIPFLILPPETKVLMYPYYLKSPGGILHMIYAGSYLIPSFLVFFYVAMGLKDFPLPSMIKGISKEPALWILTFLIFEVVVFSGMMIFAYFFWSWGFYRIIMNGLNQIVICFFIMNQRYPELYEKLKEEVRQYKDHIHLKGMNLSRLESELNLLMEKKEIYTDSNLTLKTLGSELSLNEHQLSEYLNRIQGQSFKSFINHHRIEKACRLLKGSSDQNILEIAFDSGFRSKSAFNTSFQKTMGITPSEYRRSPDVSMKKKLN